MSNNVLVEVKNCTIWGVDSLKRVQSLKRMFLNPGKFIGNKIPILENVSFSCKKGDRVALVGGNGSGKSSILKMIAGIYPPKSGTVNIQGKIASIIEMGLGIEPELTGRENIKTMMLYNNMLDSYSKEIEQQIIDFSELEEKIDQPIKNYSSGMVSRLAFSTCVLQNADILLLDEVFAAGDGRFVKKSIEFMKNKIKSMSITILVSHDERTIKEHCNRCILVKNGTIVMDGSPDETLALYNLGNY
jgi:lipopolysaccharide transport system ATP-binding protein